MLNDFVLWLIILLFEVFKTILVISCPHFSQTVVLEGDLTIIFDSLEDFVYVLCE